MGCGATKHRPPGVISSRSPKPKVFSEDGQDPHNNVEFFLSDEQLRKEWESSDIDKSGTLSLKEIVKLMDKMNLRLGNKRLRQSFFQELDQDGSGELDFEEFKVFFSKLRSRPEIGILLSKIQSKEGCVHSKELSEWITNFQYSPMTEEETASLIQKIERHEEKGSQNLLCGECFSAFISSTELNGPFLPEHTALYQRMDQSFPNYLIASSHNTYLLGDQVTGQSSVDAYISAFHRGCKCVELDCWDSASEKESEPIIYHGHTMTSKIAFRDAVIAVRDYAFVCSDLPVILSLEVHCKEEGQRMMARILKEVLGDMLPESPQRTANLPSPGDLLGKVLLKGKTHNWVPESDTSTMPDNPTKEKGKKLKTVPELAELIHLKGVHFQSFSDSKDNGKPWEMSSFSEGKATKLIRQSQVGSTNGFVEYHMRQLSRVYPKGVRFDSSNFNPIPFWNYGSQIVALNYQTPGQPNWLERGMFQGNGNSGYILKPDYLCSDQGVSFKSLCLNVTVISGWQLPKKKDKEKGEIIDPYVTVSCHGKQEESASYKTHVIKNNGWNPIWTSGDGATSKKEQSTFSFQLTSPSLILFVVSDSDIVTADDFIAQYCISVTDIRAGTRSIPLRNKYGEFYENSSLLVRFELGELNIGRI